MEEDIKAIVTNMITAIDTERTDVICSVLSNLQNEKNDHDPNLLRSILDGLHTDVGTLLHYATKQGKVDKVRALLLNGADPGIQNKDGALPIDLATDQIRTVYNEELLKATAQSNMGRVCQLLAGGVDIHLIDSPEMQNTPLHWAVCHGNRDMVQCLCARGADLNVYNARGLTPLHEAVKRGDAGIVEELLNEGANPELLVLSGEYVGQTAADMAVGNESLLQVFRAPRELPEPINKLNHYVDSKANLVRFDSMTSTDSILANGQGEEEAPDSGPAVSSPSEQSSKVVFEMNTPTAADEIDDKLMLLWPAVKSIKQSADKPFVVSDTLPIFVSPGSGDVSASEIALLWNLRRHLFEDLDLDLSLNLFTPLSSFNNAHVVCHVNKRLCPQHGLYKLSITSKQIKILCGDLDSLNYAISTILQLFMLHVEDNSITIPALVIEDQPDLPYRGVLLDISQGRISVMESLEEYLDTLSLLKINQVYLYTRFHSNMPPQWQCPHSRSEVLHITEFCDKRRLQLIPVVEVGPKVQFEDLPKLYSVFQDFLACFGKTEFVSAGPRLSSFLLDSVDDDFLSLSDVQRHLPVQSDQTLQLCGFPLHDLGPHLLQQLPPGVIFKEYAVKADHDYRKFCSPLAELGMNYFVCPGTAAWNSLAGCPEAAVANIVSAANNNDGALGMVICDWTGKGHLNHYPFSLPGVLTAAGLSWNKNTQKDFVESSLPNLLNYYVFKDRTGALGSAVMELGHAETYAVRKSRNQAGDDNSDLPEEHGSILYRFLTHPDGVPLEFLSPESIQYVIRHTRKCQTLIAESEPLCPLGDILKQEIQLTAELMLLACKVGKALVLAGRKPKQDSGFAVVNFGVSNLSITTRTDLANKLLELIKQFRHIWSQRSNPNLGLSDSVQRLRSLFKVLLPDTEHTNLLTSEVML